MASYLCISIRFLQPYSHGRDEKGDPEWPPSPLRVMQSLVAASAGRWNERCMLCHSAAAIRWLESLPRPQIVAAQATPSDMPYRLYVPDNVADKVAASWSRGHEASIADYRTEKDVLPARLEGDAVHYLYRLNTSSTAWRDSVNILTVAARSITHLGWGIDMAVGDASVITDEQATELSGLRWHPSPLGGTPLRSPKAGTLDDLNRKHADFLGRVTDEGFRPVPPLRVFDVVRYRCQDQAIQRPYRVFKLLDPNEDPARYPHAKLVHIAGMVRHQAIAAMLKDPPPWIAPSDRGAFVNRIIRGKRDPSAGNEHKQISYVPLPSIGHEHADGIIRNVMLLAPLGLERELAYLAERVDGEPLEPEGEFEDCKADSLPTDTYRAELRLFSPPKNKFIDICYLGMSRDWQTVTPVILDGHNKKSKSDKPEAIARETERLICKALQRASIETPCEFTWQSAPFLKNCLSAHKYDRNGRSTGYHRPKHLKDLTAVHVRLKFEHPVTGPLAIGAGRHCGFGVLAAVSDGASGA